MRNLLILGFLFMLSAYSFGQSDSTEAKQMYIVTKTDGTEYLCEILSDDGREILILTENLGKIYIPKSDIASMKKIDANEMGSLVNGEFRNIGPFTTRHIFTTNALPIKKGENYALINLYGPEVHFAVSDNFNIGIMTTWIASPMALALKYSIKTKNENLNFSLGTLIGTSGYLGQFSGFGGLHFANVTLGNRERSFTFGAGYGYISTGQLFFNNNDRPAEGTYVNSDRYFRSWDAPQQKSGNVTVTGAPLLSIAGVVMVGKKASFIFDSMILLPTYKGYSAQTTTITPEVEGYYDPVTSEYIEGTPGLFSHEVSNLSDLGFTALIMPGMRFQTKPNKAFQFAMAGVVSVRNGNTIAFPLPMVNWFFKF